MKTKLQKLFLAALTLAASSQKLGINLIRVAILVIFVWIGGLKFWNTKPKESFRSWQTVLL